ncbi:MAG: diadenylate cyclase, partial [Cyclobacteriaceae bacterium]
VIILFQPEIRKFLMLIGRTTAFNRENLFKRLFGKDTQDFQPLNLTAVIDAAKSLGGSNNGALIVFSRNTPLKFYAESGDELDAVISKRLLLSIFNKHSPLHDGAVIIYQGKIKAARCILPVSEQDNLPAQYGLRHRAALGMSEATDTLILVVSEETGQMSLVQNGKLKPNLSTMEIRDKIKSYYLEEKPDKNIFGQAKDPDIQTKDSDPELAEA